MGDARLPPAIRFKDTAIPARGDLGQALEQNSPEVAVGRGDALEIAIGRNHPPALLFKMEPQAPPHLLPHAARWAGRWNHLLPARLRAGGAQPACRRRAPTGASTCCA